MEKNGITEYFEDVETKEEYMGYFCKFRKFFVGLP